MRIRQNQNFQLGYTPITDRVSLHPEMLMDFGIYALNAGMVIENADQLERAYLLVQGKVRIEWDGQEKEANRSNCFDENPWCLHVPAGVPVKITSLSDNVEIALQATENDIVFEPVFYDPKAVRSDMRGSGTMKETSTRNVRTIFDKTNAPDAKLVLGEVIGYPGKWSSYPPHHHPQPEIYFYKFFPEQGYGFSELGDEAYKLINNDTMLINEGLTHPQTTAPGYAIYYLWVIRHLDDDPYITPTFLEEHKWVMDPKAKIWPDK